MSIQMLISLALLTAPPDAPTRIPAALTDCFVVNELGVAPANPPMLLDLPPSINVEGGVLVDRRRAQETAWRLQCYQLWPRAAQIALDTQANAHAVELGEQKKVTQAVATMRLEKAPDGWPPWLVALIAGGSCASIGLAVGLILGFSASK